MQRERNRCFLPRLQHFQPQSCTADQKDDSALILSNTNSRVLSYKHYHGLMCPLNMPEWRTHQCRAFCSARQALH